MRQRWATRWLIAVGLCGMLVCSGVQAAAAQAQTVPAIAAAERVVVSTDIGDDIDDAFALGLLLRSPQLQVLGIASAWGDTTLRPASCSGCCSWPDAARFRWRWASAPPARFPSARRVGRPRGSYQASCRMRRR